MREVDLYDLAHARTGDKGNRVNISLIAYRKSLSFHLLAMKLCVPA